MERGPGLARVALALAVLAAVPAAAETEQHPEVVVIVNASSPLSVAIGRYYSGARGIPGSNTVEIATSTDEAVSRSVFEREIRDPVASFLDDTDLRDEVEILVTTLDVPLIVASEGPDGELVFDLSIASVDAELALLFTGRDGTPMSFGDDGSANPYFDSERSFRQFRAADPEASPRYLVARLAGYAEPVDVQSGVPIQIRSLIDRAQAPGAPGTFVIDEDPSQPTGRFETGNLALLRPAAEALAAQGLPVLHEQSPAFASDLQSIRGYASWGSNDLQSPGPPFYGAIEGALYPGLFAPRAIAIDLVSTNARSFRTPPEYGQSLLADLVALGVSGAAGHVFEPTLSGVAHPQVLLPSFAEGAPAVEAYFRSHRFLGWVNVYVGDPLMTCDATLEDGVCEAAPVPEPGALPAGLAALLLVAALRGIR